MCGFLFVARKAAPVSEESFKAAFESMKHRGPDRSRISSGVVNLPESDQAPPVHWMAGHHRLAILDLDPRSDQPFDRDGNVLAYNGEVYNFRDVRKSHRFSGTNFETEGDTEVLFQGLRNFGLDILDHINGMFAFTYLDSSAGRLMAARDRFGKKPLFWFANSEFVCFSSTVCAIDRVLGRRPRYDPEAARQFLVHGRLYPTGGVGTHHRDIRQVPPSGTLTFDLAKWTEETGQYFKIERDTPDAAKDLPDLLEDALRLRLVSDRPVGLLLSGGVDSSLLLSIAYAKGLAGDVHYFIGDTGKSDDARFAHSAIETLGLQAVNVDIGYAGQAFDHFLNVCRHQEKPFGLMGNAMAMGEMYKVVREHGIPVALDGTGGDEIFGGYWDRYYAFALRDASAARDFSWICQTLGTDKNRIKAILNLFGANFAKKLKDSGGGLKAIARFDPGTVRDLDPLSDSSLSFQDAVVADAIGGRLGEWLWQNDRNAMMHSIENRSPILDYRLCSYLWTGYGSKFQGRWNKSELRKAFDHFHALPTQWRVQKQGFRWDRRRFMTTNKTELLEIASASETVNELVDRDKFLSNVRRSTKAYYSGVAQRLFVLSGLEASLGFSI